MKVMYILIFISNVEKKLIFFLLSSLFFIINMSKINSIKQNCGLTIDIVKSIENEKIELEKENENLKNELKNSNLKLKEIKKYVLNFLNPTHIPITSKYDFTNAPVFLKILQNIDTTEGMERYMIQLGCFITNTRLTNQLVIVNPREPERNILFTMAYSMNEYTTDINGYDLSHPGPYRSIPLFIGPNLNNNSTKKTCQYPFLIWDVKSIQDINICLEKTRISSTYKYKEPFNDNFFTIKHVTSPMMMCTDIKGFNKQDCDIINLKNIDRYDLDHDSKIDFREETEAIKSICMQVYNDNKDKVYNFTST